MDGWMYIWMDKMATDKNKQTKNNNTASESKNQCTVFLIFYLCLRTST